MAGLILDEQIWGFVEPLLPEPNRRRFRFPGRRPVENRAALIGILFMLNT